MVATRWCCFSCQRHLPSCGVNVTSHNSQSSSDLSTKRFWNKIDDFWISVKMFMLPCSCFWPVLNAILGPDGWLQRLRKLTTIFCPFCTFLNKIGNLWLNVGMWRRVARLGLSYFSKIAFSRCCTLYTRTISS